MIDELGGGDVLRRCLVARTPIGRLGDVEEIAAAIAFVASGEADFLTGSTLMIDGGWTSYSDYSGWGMVRSLMANRGQG
jgi:NAD(P)-dependent dehydrogenase (short-subunit alcohol dehydrogenase family)